MKYRIVHSTRYTYSDAVPVCHNLVHLSPRNLERQTCDSYRLLVRPEPRNLDYRTDYFGNQVTYFAIDQPHRGLTVTASSTVEVRPSREVDLAQGPNWEEVVRQLSAHSTEASLEAFQFTMASPSIPILNSLKAYAAASFPAGRSIVEAASDLTSRINSEFKYDPRATTIHTPVDEVLEHRKGVCQDFAHLQIGCFRSLGLAARYVSGYLRTIPPPGQKRLVGADASHAWLSVFCGDQLGWIDFDPTNDLLVSSDHVTVAWGRDYGDVCPVQGVIVGGGEHRMNVSTDVEPLDESGEGKAAPPVL